MSKPHVAVVLPDIHVPWHNKKLLPKIGHLLRDLRPQQLVLSGDFLDLFTLSRHNEGSLVKLGELTLSREYQVGNEVLDMLAVPSACKKHYLFGNHEDHYRRFLAHGDSGKLGNELAGPAEGLRLAERGFEVKDDWMNDSVAIGTHLEVIHGVYTNDHCSKKHLEAWGNSIIFGHSHRFGSYVNGKRGGYNIGFLGDINSPGFSYAPRCTRNRWVNGFAVVYTLDDGSFLVNAVQCWNDKFVFGGKVY